MNSIASTPSSAFAAGLARKAPAAPAQPGNSATGLTAMLLAAAVAALVVVADQLISTWADGHLLLAWVVLWAVVFAGLALFANTARRLAQRAMPWLDGWSKAIAEARAEMRVWEMAKNDPRLMAELAHARQRAATDEEEPTSADFGDALGPLGMEPGTAQVLASEWAATPAEKVQMLNGRAYNLYYI